MADDHSLAADTDKYRDVLNKAVEKALGRIFGSTASDVIYSYLEDNHSIGRDDVAGNLECFSTAMQEYLTSGAAVVEKEILKDFYSGLGLYRRVELEVNENNGFTNRLRTLMTQ